MVKQITNYNANNTGISPGNVISSASEATSRTQIQDAINNSNLVAVETKDLRKALYRQDCLIAITATSFIGGTNQLDIGANAVTYWDQSIFDNDETDTAILTGWPVKSLLSLSNNTEYYIWATFVGSVKDYEATATGAALPSNLDEKVLCGVASVDGAGAVTFTSAFQDPIDTRTHYFREPQVFQQGLTGDFTGNVIDNIVSITNAESPYTLPVDVSVLLIDASGGDVTVDLYASAGNSGKKVTFLRTDTTFANSVTLDPNAAETYDGQTTKLLYDISQGVNNGSNWLEGKPQKRVLIDEQVASNDATIEFTNNLDGGFENYELVFNNITPVTDNVYLYMRTSSDGGSSFDSGASDYSWGGQNPYTSSALNDVAAPEITVNISLSLAASGISNVATEGGLSGLMAFNGIEQSNFFRFSVHGIYKAGNSNASSAFQGGGMRLSAGIVDGLQFFFSSGNISSGTFKLYGVL